METFLRSEEQGVDAFGVVVGSLVGGAAAGEVETFSEVVGPVAAVGFAEQIEGHQVEQFGEAWTVGERTDAIADPAVDLAPDLEKRMADLTTLDEKLAEVLGLAQATQAATKKVATLARKEKEAELVELMEQMGDQAAEIEQRCDVVAARETACVPRSTRRRGKQRARSPAS